MTEEHRQTETNKCVRMNSTNYEALNLNSTHYKGCKKVIRKFFLHFHFFLVKGNKLEMICAQTHPQTDWRWGEGSARERDMCVGTNTSATAVVWDSAAVRPSLADLLLQVQQELVVRQSRFTEVLDHVLHEISLQRTLVSERQHSYTVSHSQSPLSSP